VTRRRFLVRRVSLVVVLASSTCVLLAASASGRPALRQSSFKTPSGNINCVVSWSGRDGRVQCWVLSARCFNREIGQTVAYAWALPPDRGKVPTKFCPGDFVPGASILRYGSTIRRGNVVCRSARTGLRCDREHHGFRLSRWRQLAW
jgi:Family of unknown function (DUF6636)